jgi:hypothetical protein
MILKLIAAFFEKKAKAKNCRNQPFDSKSITGARLHPTILIVLFNRKI